MSAAPRPPSHCPRPFERRRTLRANLWCSALLLGSSLAGWTSGAARANDVLATAFDEALHAQEVVDAAVVNARALPRLSPAPAPAPLLTTLLAAEAEQTWLFQPDYAEDLAHLVELLINTTPPAPLVAAALEHLGVRYRWGGTDPKRGFDCSGLVVYAARSLGITLPRTAATQARTGVAVKKADLQAGDLVFFNTRGARYSHVGIYAGNGQFIHAPRTGAVVRIESMKTSYWNTRYTGARRLPGVQVASAR